MIQEQRINSAATETRFTPLKLTSQECLNLVIKLRIDFNQTQIIERVWGVKKDGSDAWNKAYAEYKDVIETLE
ncbi:MAG: hypothetical protein HWQ43_00355 [Nostoc sp. JL31]|uniref:hypothetical protein n=1 Tax=Nostoc sp. JL31 TaxID=2815395 RepID=UPI0025F56BF0|nr:hypothetical protein [Nostoc sp. JL31]MBN3887679.1 hypothetical protein [Nostoc sp. JL31]